MYIVFTTWLTILLLCSGDIHPNPGPTSHSSSSVTSLSTSSSSLSTTVFDSLPLNHNLSFVHYNVQSILPKLEILHAELHEFDILAFSETWLNPSIDNEDILLQQYQAPVRKDRQGDAHGGVIIYVKEGIHYKRRNDLEIRGIENIWIEIANNHKSILFGLFYRPPNSNNNYFSNIEDSITLAVDTNIREIIVMGDFNYNLLNLQSSRKINALCTQFSLSQTIEEATHYTENSSSLIDLLIVSNKNSLLLSGIGDPFLNQDIRYHCPVYGILKFAKLKRKTFKRHIWDYEKGNYQSLREQASLVDWPALYDDNIDTYSVNITSKIIDLAKDNIPNRNITIHPSDPPWITSELKRYIRKRKRSYHRAKRTGNETDWSKFKKLRNQTVKMTRKCKQFYNDKIADKLRSESLSSKDWWSTLKQIIAPNSRISVPPLEVNNNIITDEHDKANVLNNFFQSQTLLDEQNAVLPDLTPATVDSLLDRIVLTPHEVELVLEVLPVGKASGPNGLSNRILKELSHQLASPFCSLFNDSLHKGVVPVSYKEAHVCPVPKKGDLSAVNNYRPISLLNSEDKLFERLVFKHLYNHLQTYNLLSSLQSGFIPGDSTVNQLTYLYNTFCQALDSGKEVRVVFCDISKAFDRVWHAGLLLKLEAAGVTGQVLEWFKSYLTNRKQRVVLPGAVSDWIFIHAGVPQGSILGPLLFLVYINDIVLDIGSNIRLFADDTSVYIVVDDPVTAAACINADLGRITQWAAKWLATFNPPKTESMLISRKLNRNLHPPLFMQNVQITEVDSHKHLGIVFSQDCSWHKHINYISEKAWTRINIMRKLKFQLDRKSLETIYIVFIRPLLEYGDVIWDNCTQ